MSDLKVVLEDKLIVVTMHGTAFKATYFKSPEGPGLMQADYMTDDKDALISRNEFLAMAWSAANEKARELGWMV